MLLVTFLKGHWAQEEGAGHKICHWQMGKLFHMDMLLSALVFGCKGPSPS